MEQKHRNVDVIRGTHKQLRQEYAKGVDFDVLWERHCSDYGSLLRYSNAMEALAKTIWKDNIDGTDRNQWVKDICLGYFIHGGIIKLKKKDARRKKYYNEHGELSSFFCGPNPFENMPCNNLPATPILDEPTIEEILLLDVGSCYNPLQTVKEFHTTAIDIAPADHTVYSCDFLNVNFGDNLEVVKVKSVDVKNGEPQVAGSKRITTLPREYYHVVVFSLLLTYVPCPHKRWELCKRAFKVLRTDGLLLIVTPDSSHQNRHAALMKTWQASIESIGYQRIFYSKDKHMHLLAFRKVPPDFIWDMRKVKHFHTASELQKLNIPQDFNEDLPVNPEHSRNETIP